MIVRDYAPEDSGAVRDILLAAFPTDSEARLVEQLRGAGDAAIELVAEGEERIAGHILLSPLQAPFRALALAPIAVAPDMQGRGIGSALISAAHERGRQHGWNAIFVLGEPHYYRRFGYDTALAAGFASPYAGPFFMAVALDGSLPSGEGEVRHAPAFAALE